MNAKDFLDALEARQGRPLTASEQRKAAQMLAAYEAQPRTAGVSVGKIMTIDRTGIATALSKCLAYLACGQTEKAYEHADRLIELLRDAGLPNLKHRGAD